MVEGTIFLRYGITSMRVKTDRPRRGGGGGGGGGGGRFPHYHHHTQCPKQHWRDDRLMKLTGVYESFLFVSEVLS